MSLNAKRETILKEVYNVRIIKLPPNARKQQIHPKVDRSQWCKLHKNYGHITKDCTSLKDQIEQLVRQELFDKYITWRQRYKKETAEELKPREANSGYEPYGRTQEPITIGDRRSNRLHHWKICRRQRNKLGWKEASLSYYGSGNYITITIKNTKPRNYIIQKALVD